MMYEYGNEKGVGLFSPPNGTVLCGITKLYGLAYINEGWLEEDKGVGKVLVNLGNKKIMNARTYVKNRYWIRTFDAAEFENGPLDIEITAFDMENNRIGSLVNTFIIDHSACPVQRRIFAAPDGSGENDGSIDSPWDLETGLKNTLPGDILYLRGGIYTQNMILAKSGEENSPVTIMNYNGEKVELQGAGIDILPDVEYVNVMGIDQSGLRFGDSGVELGESVRHIQFWDCSFNDNTHPYEEIEPNERMAYGVGFQALTVRGRESGVRTSWAIEGQNRQFITVSHCESKYNDVDGFDFSSIDHGRFQFLEAAWNPNRKTKDILQYKHADGFTIKNSEYEPWGFPSEDCVFLFCYSHHNGQDGFDIRSPHVYLFGCISHDEASSGIPYGGSGIKTWEYDYKFYNCLTFRNNIMDASGYGLEAGQNSYICNCVFYNTFEYAVARPDDDPRVTRIFSHNNIFMDFTKGFPIPVKSHNSIHYGRGDAGTLIGSKPVNPRFVDAEKGNFFLEEGSPIHMGRIKGFSFMVDGTDYMKFDSLGRPRASMDEIGPYTHFKR